MWLLQYSKWSTHTHTHTHTKCTSMLGTHREHYIGACFLPVKVYTCTMCKCSICGLCSVHPCPTEKMLQMGFTLKEIQESLTENRYDEVCATYMLLAREMKSASVSASKVCSGCIVLHTIMHLCVRGNLGHFIQPHICIASYQGFLTLAFIAHRNNSG